MYKTTYLPTLLLVGFFSVYGQENTWAMEGDSPQGYKRTLSEGQCTSQEPPAKKQRTERGTVVDTNDLMEINNGDEALVNLPAGNNDPMESGDVNGLLDVQSDRNNFDLLPAEIIDTGILNLFDVENDRHVLFAFMGTCKIFKEFVLDKYNRVNKSKRYFSWGDQPDLYATTVYFTCSRMRILLGLGANLQRELATEDVEERFKLADKRRFKKSLERFLDHRIFPETTFINAFTKYLVLFEETVGKKTHPHAAQTINAARITINQRFKTILKNVQTCVRQQGNKFQNEFVLYYYCLQFHTSQEFRNVHPIFTQSTSSLEDVFNPELRKLKASSNLSDAPNLADIWIRIIDLDPGVTLDLLAEAVDANTFESKNVAKSAQYCEMILKALEQGEQQPLPEDFENTGIAYFEAENYVKAAENFEIALEILEEKGQTPSELILENIAEANFEAGNYLQAVYYFDDYLKNLKEHFQSPSAEDLEKAAHYQSFLENSEDSMDLSQ